jgi:putative protease
MKKAIEILAPAGSRESLNAAIDAGADAVYLGLHSFSARKNAKNFTEDELREAARTCRLAGVKLYTALNTLVFDREMPALRKAVQLAAEVADAFIIQDLGVLAVAKELAPDVKCHASTQATITSVSGAQAMQKLGFERVVLSRELSLSEIIAITRDGGIETEVFIHGALCTSVSGQCHMSAFFGGSGSDRSANRGACAQPCRLNFKAGKSDYVLSLKDLSIIKHIKELESIGVTSVKIEGRMKNPEYVSSAVEACVKARKGGQYDEQKLAAVFSRDGFTDGYFTGEFRAMRGHRAEAGVSRRK